MKPKVMMELRPCFDGRSGIPNETRLVFDMLTRSPGLQVAGHLLDLRDRVNGFKFKRPLDQSEYAGQTSRYIARLEDASGHGTSPWSNGLSQFAAWLASLGLYARSRLGPGMPMGKLDARLIEDYLWRRLFEPTLGDDSKPNILAQEYYGSGLSWGFINRALTSGLPPVRLDTRNWNVYLAQTPFAGRVSPTTRLVIRYHDAIPLTHPHTLDHPRAHNRLHRLALKENAKSAWFVCNSEATRSDLLEIHPEAEPRTTVIHCVVSDDFYPEPVETVRPLLEQHVHRTVLKKLGCTKPSEMESYLHRVVKSFQGQYVLAVGSLDPRKNFASLIEAWLKARSTQPGNEKLVLVAGLGWNYQKLLDKYGHCILEGQVIVLSGLSNADLRQLYSNALVTVCPSFAEGFDYPGVESMKSGTPVIASDIRVHREIYGDAATYFDPYRSGELTDLLRSLDSVIGTAGPKQWTERAMKFDSKKIGAQWMDYLQALGQDA